MAYAKKAGAPLATKVRGTLRCLPEMEKALRAVRQQRKDLQAILDHAAIPICILDSHRRVLFANRAFCRLSGMPAKDLTAGLRCSMMRCINPAGRSSRCPFARDCDACGLRFAIEDSLATGRSHRNIEYRGEIVRVRGRGQCIFLGSTLRLDSGLRPRILLCLQDITKLKQVEEAWRESEERYRGVVEDQTEVISRFKTDGTFTFVNKAYCRFFHKTNRELLGHKWHPRALPEDLPRVQEQLARLAPSRPVVIIENRVRIGKRNVRWMQFINRGFFDPQGRLIEIQSVGRDITDLKRAELALRDREARLRALFQHSMAGILLTAPDGRIFSANPAACRMLGRTEKSICRLGRAGIVDQDDPRMLPLLRSRAQKGYAAGELNFIRADGSRLAAQVASEIFESEDGLRTSLVFQDISARKSAEEQIHVFSRNLLALHEEEKRHLSAVLHHEVGSATVGITARLSAVEAHLRKGDNRRALATLEECRRLFANAVKSLKSLAIELRPPDLDILGLHAALNQHFLRTMRETPLKIDFMDAIGSRQIPPEIQTFLFRTAQECLNNVMKHADAHRVRVRLSAAGNHIRLSVRDDGRGFAQEWGVQGQDIHLGLRSIQEWAEGLSGRMEIVSKPGSGTRVTVQIPVKNAEIAR